MLLWILQQIIISVVLIVTVHYIYIFFKNNLTVPKTKDLVKKPTQQYQKIYNSSFLKDLYSILLRHKHILANITFLTTKSFIHLQIRRWIFPTTESLGLYLRKLVT